MSSRRRAVETALGGRVSSYREIEAGWDSIVAVADEEWVFRFPRREQVERRLETEIALLPELAAALPVDVPRFEHVLREPRLCVGYRMIRGEPLAGDVDARTVAAFLSALHRFPVERAEGVGLRRPDWTAAFAEQCGEFRRVVLPLLDGDDRSRGEALLAEGESLYGLEAALVHADLGPEHLLCREGRLAGVIDWGDVRIGDPALDLSWLLHVPPSGFRDRLLDAYEGHVDDGFLARSRFYHRLAPWYEAHYGVTLGRDEHVRSGLAGVRARLALR